MASWPVSLPQTLSVGTSERRQAGFLRTKMDAGPVKQRTRYTAVYRRFQGSMLLTQAQRQTFDTWYDTILGEGGSEFDWYDPVDGSTATFRFVSPPAFTALAGGGVGANGAASLWRMVLDVEIIP